MGRYEIGILNAIQNMRSDSLDNFFLTITSLGNMSILWFSMILIFMTTKRYKKIGEIILISFFLNLIIVNIILKISVGRVRPYEAVGFTDLLINHLSDNSFPSGHTSYAASFATIILLLAKSKPVKYYVGILAILIAFSRLYLYVHYPTDVIAGAIIGMAIGVGSIKIYQSHSYGKFKKKINLQRQ